MPTHEYGGTELELFAGAMRWKRYWSSTVARHVHGRVLDLGAGIGATAQLFAQDRLTRWLALEPDAALAARIATRCSAGELPSGCEVRVGSSTDLRADERFDTVLYIDVLEHIEDDAGELARIAQHLAPGGRIVVLAPAHAFLFSAFDRHVGHFRRYDARSLRRLQPAGCSELALLHLDSVGLLASLANRLLLRQSVPTARQVAFWDRVLVPCSRLLDRLLLHRLGRSIVLVLQNER